VIKKNLDRGSSLERILQISIVIYLIMSENMILSFFDLSC
jgi:hypothetical protein